MSDQSVAGWARDADIRASLREHIKRMHLNDPADTILVEEMGLCQGEARVDLGIINGSFIGYEIKSPRDTLERLPRQVSVYCRTLDEVTVVTCGRHVHGVLELVPTWWGVQLVRPSETGINLQAVRDARRNPSLDPAGLVQLLWRSEALLVLEAEGLDRGVRTKPKQVLWDRLVAHLDVVKLHEIVRARLKLRKAWTTAQRLA